MTAIQNKENQVRALYARELRQIEDAEALLAGNANLHLADARNCLETTVRMHRALLEQTIKLTLVSDSLQNRLKSAHRELHQSLAHASRLNKSLRQLNEKKDEVLAFAAHDFRSPLAAIQGLAEILADEEFSEGSEGRQMALEIAGAAREILEMISHMLGVYRRVGDETKDGGWRKSTLQELLDRCVAPYRGAARVKNLELSAETPDPDLVVELQWELVSRVWQNLLGNAIKFTPQGGRIDLSLTLRNDHLLEFRIQDSGPGFSEEDRRHLFKKFGRLSAAPTAKEPSSGMGLQIARRIVDHLGGSIECPPSKQNGALLVVSLPVLHRPRAT